MLHIRVYNMEWYPDKSNVVWNEMRQFPNSGQWPPRNSGLGITTSTFSPDLSYLRPMFTEGPLWTQGWIWQSPWGCSLNRWEGTQSANTPRHQAGSHSHLPRVTSSQLWLLPLPKAQTTGTSSHGQVFLVPCLHKWNQLRSSSSSYS